MTALVAQDGIEMASQSGRSPSPHSTDEALGASNIIWQMDNPVAARLKCLVVGRDIPAIRGSHPQTVVELGTAAATPQQARLSPRQCPACYSFGLAQTLISPGPGTLGAGSWELGFVASRHLCQPDAVFSTSHGPPLPPPFRPPFPPPTDMAHTLFVDGVSLR
jgi:hypothetical protein